MGDKSPTPMASKENDPTATPGPGDDALRTAEAHSHVERMESLAALAGKTGHDLNNFLMAILGNTSLAMMDLTEEDAHYRYLKQVEQTANRASDFARELLTFAGKARCAFREVDLGALIREMEMLLETTLTNKCELVYELAADLPPIQADAAQLRIIVTNLLRNCCESMEATGGRIVIRTGRLELSGREFLYLPRSHSENDFVFLELKDCGIGMDNSQVKHMFDPFFSTKAKGRGRGLANVYGIVRAHLGNIIVESAPNAGTSVKILFPPSDRFKGASPQLFPSRA